MKRIYVPIIMSSILTGCSNSKMEFKQEPLTGQSYCQANIKLLPVENNKQGSLILKCGKDDFIEGNCIKGTLKILQKGKEYNINSHETLKMYINGVPLVLQIVSSFQEPEDEVSSYPMVMPSGSSFMIGTVSDVTKRNMSFLLSIDYFSKMITAKKIVFEIASSTSKDSFTLQNYPITLELRADDISFLQELKSYCISRNLTAS